jgi:hypothetical protein
MDAPIVVAVISGAVALATAVFAAFSARRLQLDIARISSALESDRIRLKHELEEHT